MSARSAGPGDTGTRRAHDEEATRAGPVAEPTAATYWGVLRHPEFGALFVAHLLSLLGDRAATVAISVLVYDRTGSLLLTASAYATSLLPWLLGAPVLAALSDRWPRRRVLLTCDLARAVLVLAMAIPGMPLAGLLVALTAVAWLGTPFEAARAATLPVLLPDEQEYVVASALTMLSNQVSQVLGLAGGGLLLTVLTTRGALLLDSATFAASAALVVGFVRARPPARAPHGDVGLLRSVLDGARFTFASAELRGVLLLAWLVAAFTVLPEGLAVGAAARLHAPEGATGLLLAAVPAGAVVGALVLGRLQPAVRARCVLPLALLGLGALAGGALASTWWELGCLWVVVGVGAAVQLPLSAHFMRSVPDAFRARAFGLAQSGLMAGQGIALIAAGAAAELASVRVALGWSALVSLLLLGPLVSSWPLPTRLKTPRPGLAMDAWIGTVAVAGVLAVAAQLRWGPTRDVPVHLSPWLLAAGFFATGSFVATIRTGRHAHVFSLDDIPRLVGLVLVSPGALISARLGGAALALAGPRRQRGRKLVFNLGSFALEVTVALTVFQALDPGGGVSPRLWPAALAATLAADLVSAATVGVVIGLAQGDLRWRRVLVPDIVTLGTALAAATVGMIAATVLWFAPTSGVLILVIVVLGMVGLRGFAQLAAEGEAQGGLQQILRELGNLEPTEESLRAALESARGFLAVEVLECWLIPVPGDEALLSGWLRVEARGTAVPRDDATRERLADQLQAGTTRPVLAEPALRGRLHGRRPRVQRLAVALSGERAPSRGAGLPLGVLVVTGPLGDGRVFNAEDDAALQAVAGMLSQALLRAEHRRQLLLSVTQDELTGLATLSEFRRELAMLLVAPQRVVVLMINLGRLRSINDVFGRDIGDDVIAAAARRTVSLAPDGSVLGRVSGHHFACAFPLAKGMSPLLLARRMRTDLEKPLSAGDVEAEAGISIGVSLAPAHGTDPDVLLRRAESAGDAAKVEPQGVAVFERELERDVARPLRLISDLRLALVDPGQLSMHYQPKRCLMTGAVHGCEALMRWQHPELGTIAPDEFVVLAESTGLIGELTALALDQSLKQSRVWRGLGLPDAVSVNLSARNLLDEGLVKQVMAALRRYDVEPGTLVLEITETSVMAEPARSAEVLGALHERGVKLSIDDFGTGYSNLSYLRDLPVQEVKLDKSLLTPLPGEAPFGREGGRSLELVRHAIALVHSLGLRVVAEGVEDEGSYTALSALGADEAQGYWISRALSAKDATAWMSSDGAGVGGV